MTARPVALVTGSSRGIGRAIAIGLGRAGYRVIVNYAERAEAARETAEQVGQAGGEAVAIKGSVARSADRQALVEGALEQFGQLDLLVNNAGITSPGRKDILEATEESWDTVFATNLKGPFFLTQLAAQQMIRLIQRRTISRGTIVNVSSISAFAVSSNRGDYCMTKAAMRMMTLLFASRLAEEGIRVYEVCPGVIASDMTAAAKEKYDRLIAEGLSPIRRWGQPEDVAKAVVALASDSFPFTTGDRVHVDGGFHIRRL